MDSLTGGREDSMLRKLVPTNLYHVLHGFPAEEWSKSPSRVEIESVGAIGSEEKFILGLKWVHRT
jgi:hypothetical protein